MGINPNSGDGVERNYTIDGRHNAENLVTEAEHTGNEAGKAFSHIAAQSDSANTGMSELSKRVAELEKQIDKLGGNQTLIFDPISGEGWTTLTTGEEKFFTFNPGIWQITVTAENTAGLRLYCQENRSNRVVLDQPTPGTSTVPRLNTASVLVNFTPNTRFFVQVQNPSDTRAYLVAHPVTRPS